MNGWFSVSRKALDHPIFDKRPDRWFLWCWLLKTAAWRDTKQDANGTIVTVKRGQLLTSYRQIEKATGVSMHKIRSLIDLLKKQHTIRTDTNTGRLLITICNYDKYQSRAEADNTPGNTETTQKQHSDNTQNEQDNNIPVGANEFADPAKVVFSAGVKLLTAAGIREHQARSIIGKWRKANTDDMLIAAIGRAQREGAVEPVSFIEGALKFNKSKSKPEAGQMRTTGTGQLQTYHPFEGWMNTHA